ncbi:helix-turn-helix domain-containing protein [Streptomyces hirsutus]|uniref:hypothetical protein n=1 Tax=Streptomyces hirsutus TaxID=35620 RepID=UPI0036642397
MRIRHGADGPDGRLTAGNHIPPYRVRHTPRQGHTTPAEPAVRLHLSEAAATARLTGALAKTGASTPAEALREARALGWV